MIIRFRTLQAKAGTKNWVRGKLARAGSIVECAISESHQTGHRHTETLLAHHQRYMGTGGWLYEHLVLKLDKD
jgi:hypothetical protein